MPAQNALTAVMEIKAGSPNYDPEKELKNLLRFRQDLIFGAVQRLGFVHFARFVFFQSTVDCGFESKPKPVTKKYFAIITSYDFDFDDYINVFIDELGEMFNLMLEHIANAPPTPVQQFRREFIEYVRGIDRTHPDLIKNSEAFFFSAYPDLTVQHIWKMQEEKYA